MKSTLLLAALLTLATFSRADGLDVRRVPADARWVGHVDIEALLRSNLFTELKKADPSIQADFDIEEIQANFGIDPFHDLRALTVYCAGATSEDTVAVLVGNEKIDQATAKLAQMEGHRSLEVGGRVVHVFGEGDETWYGYIHAPSHGSDRIVVLAKGQKLLEHGLAVLDGRMPSIASAEKPAIRAKPQPGSIVFAAASQSLAELADLGDAQASAVARLAQSFVFDLGEDRGALFAKLEVTTQKPEDALRIQQVFQGATALISLVAGDPETSARIQRLVGALRFEALGSLMTASFRYPVRDLIDELEAFEDDTDEDDDEGK